MFIARCPEVLAYAHLDQLRFPKLSNKLSDDPPQVRTPSKAGGLTDSMRGMWRSQFSSLRSATSSALRPVRSSNAVMARITCASFLSRSTTN